MNKEIKSKKEKQLALSPVSLDREFQGSFSFLPCHLCATPTVLFSPIPLDDTTSESGKPVIVTNCVAPPSEETKQAEKSERKQEHQGLWNPSWACWVAWNERWVFSAPETTRIKFKMYLLELVSRKSVVTIGRAVEMIDMEAEIRWAEKWTWW